MKRWKLWYEEDNFQEHILNGHIYALLGVYDLYRVTKDKKYYDSFIAGLTQLKKILMFLTWVLTLNMMQ